MIFSNFIKAGLNFTPKRFARRKIVIKSWPNDWVPFHWSRPEFVPGYYRGGDLVDLGSPSKEDILPDFRNSEQLQKLDPEEPARKVFSADHGKVSQFNKAKVHEHMKKLGLIHEVDYQNSLESKIISLTYTYRHLVSKIKNSGEDNTYTGHIRTIANKTTNRRFRYLCNLKELHTERYERIIEALKIEPKKNPINFQTKPVHRKVQMRELAINYSVNLKEKKVEEFMKSLEKEQAEFKEKKKSTLEWIEEQEKKLGFTV